jgi:hypothetical protein
VTETAFLRGLPGSETVGYDERGNRRARMAVGATSLTVVIDEEEAVVITVWVE